MDTWTQKGQSRGHSGHSLIRAAACLVKNVNFTPSHLLSTTAQAAPGNAIFFPVIFRFS